MVPETESKNQPQTLRTLGLRPADSSSTTMSTVMCTVILEIVVNNRLAGVEAGEGAVLNMRAGAQSGAPGASPG